MLKDAKLINHSEFPQGLVIGEKVYKREGEEDWKGIEGPWRFFRPTEEFQKVLEKTFIQLRYDNSKLIICQRSDRDCVIATFAMWLNRSWEEIRVRVEELGVEWKSNGISNDGEDKIAESYGMFLGRMPYYGGLKGLLTVPSLNYERCCHAVFVDKYNVYDPQTGNEGQKYYGIKEKHFPPYMEIAVDLLDEYSRETFGRWIAQNKKLMDDANKLMEETSEDRTKYS